MRRANVWIQDLSVLSTITKAPRYAKQCPATIQHSLAKCQTCQLCDGAKRDIFVTAHGSGAKYVTN